MCGRRMVYRVKQISDFPDYWVTPFGDVYSKKRGSWFKMALTMNHKGYYHILLDDPSYSDYYPRTNFVHKLVLTCWGPKKPDWATQVNHIDGDKTNNCVGNLEWSNNSKNQIHASINGLKPGLVKLTEDEVREIRRLWSETTLTQREIVERLGLNINRSTIGDVVHRRSWKTT